MKLPVLRVACPDQPGLVHTITKTLVDAKANIVRNGEFVDVLSQSFFMRTAFEHVEPDMWPVIEDKLRQQLPSSSFISVAAPQPKRVVICATKEFHCLGDLLLRHHFGELNAEIAAVISNHDTLRDLVERFDVPFHHIPHDLSNRDAHETALLAQLEQYQPDYIVLAKYMLILSSKVVSRWAGQLINIHHSFLPAFIGAKPYARAFERGVKMIGATAHFVTDNLDEGPIIEQQVVRIDHDDDVKAMIQAGREIETQTLAKALKLVFDDRVFINGNKTVVF